MAKMNEQTTRFLNSLDSIKPKFFGYEYDELKLTWNNIEDLAGSLEEYAEERMTNEQVDEINFYQVARELIIEWQTENVSAD